MATSKDIDDIEFHRSARGCSPLCKRPNNYQKGVMSLDRRWQDREPVPETDGEMMLRTLAFRI